MPTIDELEAALASADTDLLPASQGGEVRRVTRAQLVAGLQPQVALPAGQLLGRVSAGIGGPEPVAVGGGLALAGGTLSALPVTSLGAGTSVSQAVALAAGSTAARSVADLLADAVGPESFGAMGDGITDDTAALNAAIGSGRPVRLGPRTYRVDGQWTIAAPNTVLLGTPGLSVLKRGNQQGNGAWIAVQAPGFRADGITFDANRAAVDQESWGVLLTEACAGADLHRCDFINASGAVLGSGLVVQSSDPALSQHVIRDCRFAGNAAHGLWVQACAGVLVQGCRAHDNAAYGIVVDFNDAAHSKAARLVQVVGNRCWGNVRGIAVGNFNVPNISPPVWGNAFPDAVAVLVSGNICHDNSVYGMALAGRALLATGNLLADNGTAAGSGAGMLANVAASSVTGNTVTGTALYGIDCGGAVDSDFSGNHILGHGFAINCGGSLNLRVAGNYLAGFTLWGITVNNVETDGGALNFGIACSGLAITGNWIAMSGSAEGVWLRDGPQRVLVADNCFTGRDAGACLRADTDSVLVRGNRHDFTARFIANPSDAGGVQRLVFPDIADSVMVTYAPGGVQAMVSARQAAWAGRITFVRVTAGGSGYSFRDRDDWRGGQRRGGRGGDRQWRGDRGGRHRLWQRLWPAGCGGAGEHRRRRHWCGGDLVVGHAAGGGAHPAGALQRRGDVQPRGQQPAAGELDARRPDRACGWRRGVDRHLGHVARRALSAGRLPVARRHRHGHAAQPGRRRPDAAPARGGPAAAGQRRRGHGRHLHHRPRLAAGGGDGAARLGLPQPRRRCRRHLLGEAGRQRQFRLGRAGLTRPSPDGISYTQQYPGPAPSGLERGHACPRWTNFRRP